MFDRPEFCHSGSAAENWPKTPKFDDKLKSTADCEVNHSVWDFPDARLLLIKILLKINTYENWPVFRQNSDRPEISQFMYIYIYIYIYKCATR